jgi:hypothetical protein
VTDKIDFGGQPWQAIPRSTLRDSRLSPRAKGGLVTLLSHEEGWVRSCIGTLRRECHCGRDQARAIMRELVEAGYATITQEHRANGQFSTGYTVAAIPIVQSVEPSVPPGAVPPTPVPPGAVTQVAEEEDLEGETQEGETQKLLLAPAARERDLIFEAVAESCGWDWRNGLTKKARGTLNDAVADLKSAGATPEEIRRRAANWSYSVQLTPAALAKHWPGLATRHRAPPSKNQHLLDAAQRLREEGR